MIKKILNSFKNIKSIKTIIVSIAVITGIIAFIKVINLIENSGWLENKDRELGQLEAIRKSYASENKDLSETLTIVKKMDKLNDEAINNIINKEKGTEKKFNSIEKNTIEKLKYVKKISKTMPKDINNPYIKVNTYLYRESGKVLINNIYKAYKDVKDTK